MAENHKVDKFRKRWGRIEKLYHLVNALDKAEDHDDAFQGYWEDFIEYLQTENKNMSGRIAKLFPVGNVREQSKASKLYFQRYRVHALNFGLRNLEDIVDKLKDEDKLRPLIFNTIPIKETDMDKAHDLDKLIDSYGDKVTTLRRNLETINPDASEEEKQRYETQLNAVREHEELKSLLKDYKGLVENILVYRQLTSYLKGEGKDGEPNVKKMQELFFGYLDGLLDQFRDDEDKFDDNAPIVETIKYLAGDPKSLAKLYFTNILRPAEENLKSAAEKSDVKDYLQRNVKIMNTNKQIQFFNTAYMLSGEEEAEEREKNENKRPDKLGIVPLAKAA